ncbi:uncharacterized protein LOC143862479 [Tasmannia lanceolata]|uniref:uncharacterized protein LOC143862479 n=1 Tax=Tasmannia lanceolata TaxID=3420 RepID=UPI00406453B1
MATTSTSRPKEHIEEIRRVKFSIGGEPNLLTEDLHQAVKNLSAELYAKDVHFLMELIQNAEDNEYPAGVKPSLEFIITSKDITLTGATATLLIFNNEKGFFPKNIDSICSVGRSTKKGNRQRGYIGEKGIGFKSVFLITSQPYIFSNGYQIRFNEDPLPDCNVGYIVPEWVEENPTLSDIHQIYGSDRSLPTTVVILPLKFEKVGAVKQQLSSIHPEVLLFLSKIKRLSVREDNDNPSLNTVSAISISSETDFQTRKNIDAESYTLRLSAEEDSEENEKECSYYMWRQKFPVKLENRVERRMEVEEWMITLAFPNGARLNRRNTGQSFPGIYAFLPTEMFTNFPFIIQADFVLASSRETILLDNKWNKGILNCVPSAFVNAFISLVKATESAPVSSLPPMFEYLPVGESLYPELNTVREAIKAKVVSEHIIPCESYTQQKIFCQPKEVGRLMPAFWNILIKARVQGVNLHNLSSHGTFVLNSSFDKAVYDYVLDFLDVGHVDNEWYAKCINSSNLVSGVSEEVYMELLYFFAENWGGLFRNTNVKTLPLLKCVDQDGNVSLLSINRATQLLLEKICLSSDVEHISWLINWNREFRCAGGRFFMPSSTQVAFKLFSKRETVQEWLREQASVEDFTVNGYGELVVKALNSDKRLVIAFTHFLYHSYTNNYMSEREVSKLCSSMPLVDSYGCMITQRRGVLVPANGSKWVGLLGSNPWRRQSYVELGEDYIRAGYFANVYASEKQLMPFLERHANASDIPNLCPPDAEFATVSSPLTKENTFLLLEWIQNLRRMGITMHQSFLQCIRNGSWLKTSVGYKPPSESFLSSSDWGSLLQMGSVLVDIPLIDQEFYGNRMSSYKEELKTIGVMFEFSEACKFIGKHLMSLATFYSLSRANVLCMLNFIKFLSEKYLSPKEFIESVKDGRWLRTSHGVRSPVGSVLFDPEWTAASQISYLPFIDKDYYGDDILNYRTELQLLGVVVGFNENYQLVVSNLRLPSSLSSLTADSIVLILECIRHLRSCEYLIRTLKGQRWVKTNLGYKLPDESLLFDSEWGCLLNIVDDMPLIDEEFYGPRIRSYKNELKEAGVVVSFEGVSKSIAKRFKQLASKCSVTKGNVLSLLDCYRNFKKLHRHFSLDLLSCICDEEWLLTSLGYRSPKESVLFDAEWESISPIASLPFINDSDQFYGKDIYEYKDELKAFGSVVEFKEGSRFVFNGLRIPGTPSEVAPASVLSLLKCIRNFCKGSLPEEFLKCIDKRWLKTHVGYRSPRECILFDSTWTSFLQREDGPLIDEAFYGSEISSYKPELDAIGVTLDAQKGCSLVAGNFTYHSQFDIISRIYTYLNKFNWEPDHKSAKWIWIPNGCDKGEWVSPEGCVLHDKDNLFSVRLNVLEKHYDKKLFGFFSVAFGVRHSPNIDDYLKLWNDWENSRSQLTCAECNAFLVFVTKHWNKKTEKLLTDSIKKLPVGSALGEILLLDKQDVFIPDDLQLKDLFEKASPEPVFVWYPQPSSPSMSLSKLYDIYGSIGVKTISEGVKKDDSLILNDIEFKNFNQSGAYIGRGLFRIILGFLADSSFEMSVEMRRQILKYLRDTTVLETDEPITVSYILSLSSGKSINANASRMIRWERENAKLFIQKNERSSGHKARVEFATYFSEVISSGLLWENPDRIAGLSELIKLGFFCEFEEDAVEFLLKTKNLQLFIEDEVFLSSLFPSK